MKIRFYELSNAPTSTLLHEIHKNYPFLSDAELRRMNRNDFVRLLKDINIFYIGEKK